MQSHSNSTDILTKTPKQLTKDYLQEYRQRYPQQRSSISPTGNILSAILVYFEKENVHIMIDGTDIFNQQSKQSVGHQGVQQYFEEWINLQYQDQQLTVQGFLDYLVEKLGDRFTVKINPEASKQHEQLQQNTQEQPLDEQNQFQIKENKSEGESRKNKFTPEQIKYLQVYYRHFCGLNSHFPKGKTFDDIKQMHESMELPQWMMFCKKANLILKNTDFNHNSRHKRLQNELTIKQLSKIYQENEGNNKKLVFEQFCGAVSGVIQAINKNNNSGNFSSVEIDPFKFIGLTNQTNNFETLDKFGIKYIKQKVYFYNLASSTVSAKQKSLNNYKQSDKSDTLYTPKKSSSKHSLKNSSVKLKPLQKQRQEKILSQLKSKNIMDENSSTINQKKIHEQGNRSQVKTKKQIKYYRSRQQRKQSELMKKLNISNLGQIKMSDDVLCNISQIGSMDENDYFLREYNRKQREVSEGVVSRLDRKIKRMAKKIR